MLDAQEATAGSEDALHLVDHLPRLLDGAEHQAADHRSHAARLQVDALGSRAADLELDVVLGGAAPQRGVHVVIRLDGDHPGARLQVAEVGSGAGPQLDDGVGKPGEELTLQRRVLPVHVPIHPLEERRVDAASNGVGVSERFACSVSNDRTHGDLLSSMSHRVPDRA